MDSTSTSTEPTPPPLPPSTTQPSEPPRPSSTSSATAIPTSSSTSTPNPNPNPNPTPQTSTTPLQQQQPQSRPQPNRARPQSTYPRPSSTSFAPSMFASPATTPTQQGGLGLAHQPRAPFSTYQQQQFGVLGRNPTNIPNPNTPTATQVKQPSVQGIQTIGNFGSLSGSQLRPGGLSSLHNQPRPLQSTIRPQTTINQHQRFQSHGLMRAPTMNSPSSPSSSTPHVLQTHTQPWMSAPNQGKQVHPSYRQQIRPQNLQQRSQNPQQHPHPTSTVSNQQVKSSQQETPLPEVHLKEIHARQHPGTRVPQSVLPQPLDQRGVGLGNQKSPTITTQAGVQSGPANNVDKVDAGESTTHILSKRSIRELVSQIDPSEKLDPEVEDILIEIAEDFVDSITTVGCSLAKHRKSATLEAKDILLHLEKNWNMALPGFGGDEIKGYKKQLTNDIHKERLAAVKKSMVGADAVHVKSTGGQAAGNMKSPVAKAPIPGSPKAQEIS